MMKRSIIDPNGCVRVCVCVCVSHADVKREQREEKKISPRNSIRVKRRSSTIHRRSQHRVCLSTNCHIGNLSSVNHLPSISFVTLSSDREKKPRKEISKFIEDKIVSFEAMTSTFYFIRSSAKASPSLGILCTSHSNW